MSDKPDDCMDLGDLLLIVSQSEADVRELVKGYIQCNVPRSAIGLQYDRNNNKVTAPMAEAAPISLLNKLFREGKLTLVDDQDNQEAEMCRCRILNNYYSLGLDPRCNAPTTTTSDFSSLTQSMRGGDISNDNLRGQ